MFEIKFMIALYLFTVSVIYFLVVSYLLQFTVKRESEGCNSVQGKCAFCDQGEPSV
jgi:hypothetical protein